MRYVTQKAKKYIRDHLSEPLNRNTIAGYVYLSPDYLSHIFKTDTGIHLSEYILNERLLRAKQMLKETPDSISSITLAVGFSNSAYFTKVFKASTGMTPSQYRKGKS